MCFKQLNLRLLCAFSFFIGLETLWKERRTWVPRGWSSGQSTRNKQNGARGPGAGDRGRGGPSPQGPTQTRSLSPITGCIWTWVHTAPQQEPKPSVVQCKHSPALTPNRRRKCANWPPPRAVTQVWSKSHDRRGSWPEGGDLRAGSISPFSKALNPLTTLNTACLGPGSADQR